MNEDDLPEGWRWAKLGDGLVVDIQPGFACGTNNRSGEGVPHLRPMNVTPEGRISLADLKSVPKSEVYKDERWVRTGDILFNNTNSPELVGKTAYYDLPEPRAFSNHMTRLRTNSEHLDSRFCATFLHQLWRDGHFERICNNHVSQASISRNVLSDTSIPLPPVAEQKRIVAKVEELLASVNAARDRLARIPSILSRFRESVLLTACSGRLSADAPSEVPPTPLRNVGDLDLQDLPDIPDRWKYIRADCVIEPDTVITYGVVLPGRNVPDGVPYIRGLDIESGQILSGQLWRMKAEIAEKHIRSSLKKGDVLLCIIRHLKVAVVPDGLDGANLTQGTVRLRPSEHVLGRYLATYLQSPQAQEWMKHRYFGMDMPRINVRDARALPIAVPPFQEQVQIVHRVDALFALARSIGERLTATSARADKLAQSILARAFQGAL